MPNVLDCRSERSHRELPDLLGCWSLDLTPVAPREQQRQAKTRAAKAGTGIGIVGTGSRLGGGL